MKIMLYVLVGIPASGKSSFAREEIFGDSTWGLLARDKVYYISRDKIREALRPAGQPYFSCEKEVYKRYIKSIQDAIDKEVERNLSYGQVNIYADATHATKASRRKLLSNLHFPESDNRYEVRFCEVGNYYSLDELIKRDSEREKSVGEKVIRDFYKRYEKIKEEELYGYREMYKNVDFSRRGV